jgi:hypothetical protein
MRKMMTLVATATASLCTPAGAATVVQNFGGIAPYDVDAFDPSLGTLNAIQAKVTGGSATYQVVLDGYLAASTTYSASAYFGIYLGPLTIDGSTKGMGTVDFVDGAAEIVMPVVPYTVNIPVPTDPLSASYMVLIGLGTTSATLTVDPPFNLTFGDLSGRNISDVKITGRNATWSLVYDYTPFGSIVPEPSTWGMMVVGFALVGAAARSRRRKPVVAIA